MNKLILTAALLALATPAFAEEAPATLTDEHENHLPAIETTFAEEVSGTEVHVHDSQDMFDEAAPTAEHPEAE